MATEYYLVNNTTKTTFYLGKRITKLQGVSSNSFNNPSWKSVLEVQEDIKTNCIYFDLDGWTAYQYYRFCEELFNFSQGSVKLVTDIDRDWPEYNDWFCSDFFTDEFFTACDATNAFPIFFTNNKNKKLYQVICECKNCTNGSEDVKMILYKLANDKERMLFVRTLEEFKQKFTEVKQWEDEI